MFSFPATNHSSLSLLRIWTLNMDRRFREHEYLFILFWFLFPSGSLKVVTVLDNENTSSIVLIKMFKKNFFFFVWANWNACCSTSHLSAISFALQLIDQEINPYVDKWEAEGTFPAHRIFKILGNAGFLGVSKPVGKKQYYLHQWENNKDGTFICKSDFWVMQ